MIQKIIEKRMNLLGLSQKDLAEKAELTASQVSTFLNGSTLNQKAIEKVLMVLDIDLEMYEKRFDLAKTTAERLKSNKVPVDDVIKMSKAQMARECEEPDISLFFDIKEKDASLMIEKGLVDYESTFVFFKAMVIQMMNSDMKFTNSDFNRSWDKILRSADLATDFKKSMPIASLILLGPLGWMIAACVMLFSKYTLSMPLKILSKDLFKNK